MRIRLSNGVILQPKNDEVARQYLKYGATEVNETVTPKKSTKKSATKVASAKEAE